MSSQGEELWRFSLTVYGRSGVPERCLALQDRHGVDVNVMLYLLFRAASGTALDREAIARLDGQVEVWRTEVVRPLRAVRRALKTTEVSAIAADEDKLRSRVKSAELEAERLQQQALARLGASLGTPSTPPAEAGRLSLRAYADHLGTALSDETLDDFLAITGAS